MASKRLAVVRKTTTGQQAGLANSEEVERGLRREEGFKILRAVDRYGSALEREHQRLFSGRLELAETHMEARRQELEMAKRHYGQNSAVNVKETVEQRLQLYIEALQPRALVNEHGQVTNTESESQQEWSREVCNVVVQDMRREWRSTQKNTLMAIARELKHEYQAATDILEKSLKSWQQLDSGAKKWWDKELSKAQEQLDKLAEGYKKALQVLYEAELREVRQHTSEQGDFFRGEIRQAEEAEELENEKYSAQIRRMQIAVLKWHHDYVKDAEQKACEVAARRRLVYLDGIDPFEGGEDDDEAPAFSVQKTQTLATTIERNRTVGFEMFDEDDDEERMEAAQMAQEVLRMSGASSKRLLPMQAGMKKGMLRRLRGQKTATMLKRSRTIVNEIHAKLPADPAEVRAFLLKVEAAVPASSDILRLYEEHLAEHGVLLPLAVHRPPSSPAPTDSPIQDGGSPSPSMPETPGLSPRRRKLVMSGDVSARLGRSNGSP